MTCVAVAAECKLLTTQREVRSIRIVKPVVDVETALPTAALKTISPLPAMV